MKEPYTALISEDRERFQKVMAKEEEKRKFIQGRLKLTRKTRERE